MWGDTSYLELHDIEEIINNENDRFRQVNTLLSKISGSEPHKIELDHKVVSIASGEKHVVLVTEKGDV